MEPRPAHTLSLGLVCSVGIGPTRGGRARNEDNYLVCRDDRVAWREGGMEVISVVPGTSTLLVAVADGMGGHDDGDLASSSAVQAVSRLYSRPVPDNPEDTLREFLLDAHRRLRARAAQDGKANMGTTLTVGWVIAGRLVWAHVGDSRLYLWREGCLTQLSRDHTRAEFASRDGRLIPSHPGHLAQNFIYGSRGLGDDTGVRIDRGLDTGSLHLAPGDRLVFVTDGVSGRVDSAWIADAVRHVPDPGACAVALMERAMAAESDDNITALVLRVEAANPANVDLGGRRSDTTLVPL